MTTPILVLSNLPDQASAEKLAHLLVGDKVVACVNIMAPCTSVYHWQGKLEQATEVPVLIKTCLEKYPLVEKIIRANHPYELPEIIHVRIDGGLPDYLAWVAKETTH